jgi:hypothetical protein
MARTDMSIGEAHDEEVVFWSGSHDNYPATDLKPVYVIMKENFHDAFATYLNSGSSWKFKEVKRPSV